MSAPQPVSLEARAALALAAAKRAADALADASLRYFPVIRMGAGFRVEEVRAIAAVAGVAVEAVVFVGRGPPYVIESAIVTYRGVEIHWQGDRPATDADAGLRGHMSRDGLHKSLEPADVATALQKAGAP